MWVLFVLTSPTAASNFWLLLEMNVLNVQRHHVLEFPTGFRFLCLEINTLSRCYRAVKLEPLALPAVHCPPLFLRVAGSPCLRIMNLCPALKCSKRCECVCVSVCVYIYNYIFVCLFFLAAEGHSCQVLHGCLEFCYTGW
jgi:hypothetical protein